MIVKIVHVLTLLLCSSLPTNVAAFAGTNPSGRVFVGTPVQLDPRTVKDCMTNMPYTLSPDTPVDEAITKLLKVGLSGAPVVDQDSGKLLGMVTTFDFLQKEAGGGTVLPMEGSMETVEGYVDLAKKICAQKVEEIMTKDPLVIESSASMKDAAFFMTTEKLHRLPVLENGRLVGILTASDVMSDLVRTVNRLSPAAEDDDESGPRP